MGIATAAYDAHCKDMSTRGKNPDQIMRTYRCHAELQSTVCTEQEALTLQRPDTQLP